MKRIIVLILLICLLVTLPGCVAVRKPIAYATPEPKDDLYALAVEDSLVAEESEIFPLVTLTKDSDMVTWNEDGTKVLLISWHKYPESYIAGEEFTCSYGEVWVFTDKEICAWYDENHAEVEDWNLRLEQLIGLAEVKEYTHFTAFWVELDELIRPAFQTDVTLQLSKEHLDGSALGEHREWFNSNEESSYSGQSPHPWTRLGYTFDWADNGKDYGLTEFIILADSVVEVEWTLTTEEFVNWMAAN